MEKPKTKLEEWNASELPAQWLSAQLAHPMGQFFLEVLKERHPMTLNRNLPAAVHTVNGTTLSAQMTGYEQCLQNIKSLCSGSEIPFVELKRTYGVTKPEDATE